MKKRVKTFLIWFPVILVFCQVLLNLLALISMQTYLKYGFYLDWGFGTNFLIALFFVCLTWSFDFCEVSRWAAIAELLFAIFYVVIKDDNIYNIMFQVIVGSLALIGTFIHYIIKFPKCKLSLFIGFIACVLSTKGNCSKGYEKWVGKMETKIDNELSKKYS